MCAKRGHSAIERLKRTVQIETPARAVCHVAGRVQLLLTDQVRKIGVFVFRILRPDLRLSSCLRACHVRMNSEVSVTS